MTHLDTQHIVSHLQLPRQLEPQPLHDPPCRCCCLVLAIVLLLVLLFLLLSWVGCGVVITAAAAWLLLLLCCDGPLPKLDGFVCESK